MDTLKRPLVLICALIVVTLLISWRYFEDGTQSFTPAYLPKTGLLSREDFFAFMADNANAGEIDQPPAAEDVLVQRIPGDDWHLLLMAYYSKENYAEKIVTIENGSTIILRDDGKGFDKVAGDGLYTTKITADVKAFRKQAINMLQQMRASGFKPIRYLHRARIIDPDASESFDANGFDRSQPISISGLTNALSADFTVAPATTSKSTSANMSGTAAASAANTMSVTATSTAKPTLLDSIKQNCILITNLAVIEDPARTWNTCAKTGNVNGAWTFGTLMRQLASKSPNQIATDAQLSDYIKKWLNNWAVTQVVNGDTVAARTLINNKILTPWLNKSQNQGAPAGQLDMRFTPFKLTAILNRFDLRDGKKFGIPGHPCGEGRFVFCLINSDCSGSQEFTVIFEYGINKPNTCESQHSWAQQWLNLKNLPIGSAQYNQALQNITDQFTLCGTNPARPNQSSIDQVRTNEVALSPNPELWELREFVLDKTTGNLVEHTVAQNPADKYNAQVPNADVKRMVDYVNNHQTGINSQTNITPDSVKGVPFLGAVTRVLGEGTGAPPNVYHWNGTDSTSKTTFIPNNNTRFNFSLQTCTGCHAGETQTSFTHIDPAFYGEQAGLSGFMSGKAGRGSAIDFDDNANNGKMSIKDAALRPSAATATIRTFNDIDARARGLKSFTSTTCGNVLAISSQLLFQPTSMVH